MTKEERIAKAVALFKEGYNCSQSVVGAYADLYGFTPEQAFRMSASFGAGIGRMRMTCGAACGMFLLAGLERSAVVGADRASKSANYALVQELFGTRTCRKIQGTDRYVDLRRIVRLVEERTDNCPSRRAYAAILCQAALPSHD